MIPPVGLYAAAAALAAALLWGGWQYVGKLRAERALLEYQAAAAQVISERLIANAALEAQHQRKTVEVTREYEKRVSTVRGRYAAELERLRDAAAGSGSSAVPEAGEPAPGADATASERRFVEALERCEADRERLKALQEWASHANHP